MNKHRVVWLVSLLFLVFFISLFLLLYFVMPLFSCGYSKEQEKLARDLFAGDLVATEIDTIHFQLESTKAPFELAREDFSVFLSMVPQNRPASVSELGRRMPMLTIRHVDGTECVFEFYGAEDYIILGASCLRYEGSEWSIGAGEAYDWIVAKD